MMSVGVTDPARRTAEVAQPRCGIRRPLPSSQAATRTPGSGETTLGAAAFGSATPRSVTGPQAPVGARAAPTTTGPTKEANRPNQAATTPPAGSAATAKSRAAGVRPSGQTG